MGCVCTTDDQLLTVLEAARWCGVNKTTIARAIKAGRIPLAATNPRRVTRGGLRAGGYAPEDAPSAPSAPKDAPHAPDATNAPGAQGGSAPHAPATRTTSTASSEVDQLRDTTRFLQQQLAEANARADNMARLAGELGGVLARNTRVLEQLSGQLEELTHPAPQPGEHDQPSEPTGTDDSAPPEEPHGWLRRVAKLFHR